MGMPNTAKLVPNAAAGHGPGLNVLTSPNFIIEKDGELYLAVAVLKYSEREAEAETDPRRKEEKKKGVARVRQMFIDGINSDHTNLDCCQVLTSAPAAFGEGDTTSGMNTEPPGMNTSPE
jgi:hypothetical protein